VRYRTLITQVDVYFDDERVATLLQMRMMSPHLNHVSLAALEFHLEDFDCRYAQS
jgi:hypothetical protein